MDNPEVIEADYGDPIHGAAIITLLQAYAKDPMGGGCELSGEVTGNLIARLSRLPHAFSVLAFAGAEAVGLANCFEGFSTFLCRPLVNIHDLVVLPDYRQRGIGQALLQKVETIARHRGACKLTLEVLSGNEKARNSYRKFGFEGYQLDPAAGEALFWQKRL